MGKETEYKLAVGDLQLLDCILCSRMVMEKLCAPYAYLRMRTTYYDTEDGFLAQRRWMLRLRTEDGRSVVTMKTPGEGHTRGEWEVESEYLDEALSKLAALGAPQELASLQPDALAPICGASFTRITAELRLTDDTACMICGDVGDLTGGRADCVCAGTHGHLLPVRAAAQQAAARKGAGRINCRYAAENEGKQVWISIKTPI